MAKGMTKSDFVAALAEKAGLDKKQAAAAIDAITAITVEQLKSAGELTLPGLVKLSAVHKAAQPERAGVNPFTKQPITIKAKPASMAVKARPMKTLKDSLS